MSFKGLIKTTGDFCSRNASTILTISTCIGIWAGCVMAFKAGEKTAVDISKLRSDEDDIDDIPVKDKAKIIVKNGLPVVIIAGATTATAISSHVIDAKKIKAMATSYALLAESADIYRRKVIERVGDHKEDEVRGSIAKEAMEKDFDSVDISALAKNTDGGTYIIKDGVTGQYFYSDRETIDKAIRRLNSYYIGGEDFVTVGEYASALGLEDVCDGVKDLCWPSAMTVDPDIMSTICPNGTPGYYIYFPPEKQPMNEELAEIYNTNHFVSSTYDY